MIRGNAGLPMEHAPKSRRRSAPTPRKKSSRKKYLTKRLKVKSAPTLRNKTRSSFRKSKSKRKTQVKKSKKSPKSTRKPSQSALYNLSLYQNPSPQLAQKLKKDMKKTRDKMKRRRLTGMSMNRTRM